MNDIIIKINYIGHIFLIGIIDSISYHKTLPILILSSQIASDFFQVIYLFIIFNLFLLSSSLFIFIFLVFSCKWFFITWFIIFLL